MQLQLKTHHEGVPPGLLLLTLLCKSCQDCLGSPSVSSVSEVSLSKRDDDDRIPHLKIC